MIMINMYLHNNLFSAVEMKKLYKVQTNTSVKLSFNLEGIPSSFPMTVSLSEDGGNTSLKNDSVYVINGKFIGKYQSSLILT